MTNEDNLAHLYPPVAVDEPATAPPSGKSLASLIDAYTSDPDSSFNTKLRSSTKDNYNSLMRRIRDDHGVVDVRDITGRTLLQWHTHWLGADNHVAMSHSLIGMLRTLSSYGSVLLDDPDCRRLKQILTDSRFPMPKARTVNLTADQVVAIRAKAHEMGYASIALAQAFQFEGTFRQKDVIGERVKRDALEPYTHLIGGDEKWGAGITWSEIDRDLVLRHVTSKRQKPIEIDLKYAPMVREELKLFLASDYGKYLIGSSRESPIIISERTGEPYHSWEFRHAWRKIASSAGIPKHIKNMDTRAGAITEAIESGASLEDARKTATHSDSGQTAKYSRGDAKAVVSTMKKRVANRARAGGR